MKSSIDFNPYPTQPSWRIRHPLFMRFFFIAITLIFLSTSLRSNSSTKIRTKERKLHALYQLPFQTELDYYDLSNDGLTEFPNLSMYKIKHLNISHNDIERINESGYHKKKEQQTAPCLPEGIEILDISHNKLQQLFIPMDYAPQLKRLDASYNRLEGLQLTCRNLKEVNLSHNKINFPMELNSWAYPPWKVHLHKLNLRDNPLSWIPDYYQEYVDTLLFNPPLVNHK